MRPIVKGYTKAKPKTIDSFFARQPGAAPHIPSTPSQAKLSFGDGGTQKRARPTTDNDVEVETTGAAVVGDYNAIFNNNPPLATASLDNVKRARTGDIVVSTSTKRKHNDGDNPQNNAQGSIAQCELESCHDSKRACVAAPPVHVDAAASSDGNKVGDVEEEKVEVSSGRTAVGQRWVTNDQYKVHRYPAHPRNKNIKMDEEPHIYYMNGSSRFMTSVTTILKRYEEEFGDGVKKAKGVIRKSKNNPDYAQYAGKAVEEVVAGWKANGILQSGYGTALHASIEQFYCNQPIDRSHLETEKEWTYFENFHRDVVVKRGWDMYLAEWIVYAEELFLAGSVDAPFALSTKDPKKIVLIDWKRCKNIEADAYVSKYGGMKCMLPPCDEIGDCKKGNYKVQLNFYKWLFETYYGVEVVEMYIVAFHPHTQSNYIMIPVDPIPEVIAGIVADRKREVAQLLAHEKQLMARERAARHVVVVGSHEWTDAEHMGKHLDKLAGMTHLHVCTPGTVADLAVAHSSSSSSSQTVFRGPLAQYADPANADNDAANAAIAERFLDKYTPDIILAFHDDLPASKTTRFLVEAAKRRNILTTVVTHFDAQYSQS